MAAHNDLGKLGEKLAVEYLENVGYQILETNWRFSRSEVDIIAKDDEILVFVEVKTRSNASFAQPEASISPKKELFITDAAAVYMELIQHEWEIRFDVIAIIISEDKNPKINHYKDSFFPSLG